MAYFIAKAIYWVTFWVYLAVVANAIEKIYEEADGGNGK